MSSTPSARLRCPLSPPLSVLHPCWLAFAQQSVQQVAAPADLRPLAVLADHVYLCIPQMCSRCCLQCHGRVVMSRIWFS